MSIGVQLRKRSVAVVIPAYNCAPFLERAVQSARRLQGVQLEIIVIDDGSTDETPEVLSELRRRDSELKVIRTVNGGLSVARNRGVDAASAEYVFLLDADDEALACDLGEALSAEVDVVRIGVEECGPGAAYTLHAEPEELCTGRHHLARQFARDHFFTASCAYIYRTAWLRQHQLRFVPGLLHEDNLFTVQALLAAQTLRVLPTPVYRYIRREGSITTAPGDARRLKRIDAYCQIAAELTRMANQDRGFDLRWKIQEVLDGAHTLARQCQGRSGHARVLRAHLRYMLAYRGVGAPGFRYLQRHRATTYARAWWQGQQAAQR